MDWFVHEVARLEAARLEREREVVKLLIRRDRANQLCEHALASIADMAIVTAESVVAVVAASVARREVPIVQP